MHSCVGAIQFFEIATGTCVQSFEINMHLKAEREIIYTINYTVLPHARVDSFL